MTTLSALLDGILAEGWLVAAHNNYRQAGKTFTFWLFTRGDECVKGEGLSDVAALTEVRDKLDDRARRIRIHANSQSKPRVFIESPFSSGTPVSIPQVIERNKRYLRAAIRHCVERGETAYASHLMLTQEGVLDDLKAEERKLGIELGFAMRRVLDITAFYTELGWSSGMLHGKLDTELHISTRPAIPHTLEERQIGGVWAGCGLEFRCHAPSGAPKGPDHGYQCPFWRPRVEGT